MEIHVAMNWIVQNCGWYYRDKLLLIYLESEICKIKSDAKESWFTLNYPEVMLMDLRYIVLTGNWQV